MVHYWLNYWHILLFSLQQYLISLQIIIESAPLCGGGGSFCFLGAVYGLLNDLLNRPLQLPPPVSALKRPQMTHYMTQFRVFKVGLNELGGSYWG